MENRITEQMMDVLWAISDRLDEIDRNRQQYRILNRQFIQQNGFALLRELNYRDQRGCCVRFDLLFSKSPTTSEKSAHCRRLRMMESCGLIKLFNGGVLSAIISGEVLCVLQNAVEFAS